MWMLSNATSTAWRKRHRNHARENQNVVSGRARELDHSRKTMKIKLTSLYVDDQEKALRFYTEVLGFVKKADFRQGPFRWLTVASPEEPDATELQLAPNSNPAARAYQQARFGQARPAAMFYAAS